MTLKLEGDLNILKMYLPAEKCSSYIKTVKSFYNNNRGMAITSDKVKSNIIKFQPPLAIAMEHIPTNFGPVRFRGCLQTDRCTDRETDRQTPPKTIPAHSIAGAHVNIENIETE